LFYLSFYLQALSFTASSSRVTEVESPVRASEEGEEVRLPEIEVEEDVRAKEVESPVRASEEGEEVRLPEIEVEEDVRAKEVESPVRASEEEEVVKRPLHTFGRTSNEVGWGRTSVYDTDDDVDEDEDVEKEDTPCQEYQEDDQEEDTPCQDEDMSEDDQDEHQNSGSEDQGDDVHTETLPTVYTEDVDETVPTELTVQLGMKQSTQSNCTKKPSLRYFTPPKVSYCRILHGCFVFIVFNFILFYLTILYFRNKVSQRRESFHHKRRESLQKR
jgi:hypothetical protein